MNQYIESTLLKNECGNLRAEATRLYGAMSEYHLDRTLEVVHSASNEWNRVFAVRADGRTPNAYWGGDPDLPTCFPRIDSQIITRFFESLKSQLCEEHWRNGRRGEPSLPKYIWVREKDTGEHPHYHFVLLFNKDQYAFLGNYGNSDANNMATRIQRAWCSALALPYPDYKHLVHFPSNPAYVFDRKSAVIHAPSYKAFLIRIAYLCKVRTKPVGDGFRNFGCSQTNR